MVENLMSILANTFRRVELGNIPEEKSKVIIPVVPSTPNRFADEIAFLEKYFGERMIKGTYRISLQTILKIIPKQRRRADAYKGLVCELKKRGVILEITSAKRK